MTHSVPFFNRVGRVRHELGHLLDDISKEGKLFAIPEKDLKILDIFRTEVIAGRMQMGKLGYIPSYWLAGATVSANKWGVPGFAAYTTATAAPFILLWHHLYHKFAARQGE